MKIRTGFVSNSSSSSFCLVGSYLDLYDKDNLKEPRFNFLTEKEKQVLADTVEVDPYLATEHLREFIHKRFPEYVFFDRCEGIYFGRNINLEIPIVDQIKQVQEEFDKEGFVLKAIFDYGETFGL